MLRELIADPTDAPDVESFERAARRIARGNADRIARLKRYAFPEFGHIPVTAVKRTHVIAALDAAVAAGRQCTQLRIDCTFVLGVLVDEEVLTRNVASKAKPTAPPVKDERPRVVLTDAEFWQVLPALTLELRTMAMSSRLLGGMRTSELHEWRWEWIAPNWQHAQIWRKKTNQRQALVIPEALVPALQEWHHDQGSPATGFVFPVRTGRRAGQRKAPKTSYAARLRAACWAAGVRRGETKEACPIQSGSLDFRPLDFHSFRRQFNTGLAQAGVNVQQAMALAGHRSAATHMRYVRLTEILEIPTEALTGMPVNVPVVPSNGCKTPGNAHDRRIEGSPH
jgi:integrase